MGLDLGAISLLTAGTQVASGVMGFLEQKKADKAAKTAAYKEAAIMEADADEQARLERNAAKEHSALQRVLYASSGVSLQGSPLLEVQKTVRKGEYNADNITASAAAKADLTRQQGSISRASLLGSVLDTTQNVLGTYYSYQSANRQLGKTGG